MQNDRSLSMKLYTYTQYMAVINFSLTLALNIIIRNAGFAILTFMFIGVEMIGFLIDQKHIDFDIQATPNFVFGLIYNIVCLIVLLYIIFDISCGKI